MRIVNKISLWFIGLIIILGPACTYISYTGIKRSLYKREHAKLLGLNDRIANELRQGKTMDGFTTKEFGIQISTVTEAKNGSAPLIETLDCASQVSSFYEINGKTTRITTSSHQVNCSEILSGILYALLWKMILTLSLAAILATILSRRLLSSFKQTMAIIKDFDLKHKNELSLPTTSIKEFKELNHFVTSMATKAVADYASVKEFNENASHELRTPLAVLQTKLEMLTDTISSEKQIRLIGEMQGELEKLTRINKSLMLLTKLENNEFNKAKNIDIANVLTNCLPFHVDRAALKEIKIHSEITENDFALKIDPVLAEILINNLLSNAIGHNYQNGFVTIRLTPEKLQIQNTGQPLQVPPNELFQRFKKNNQCADSIGLGLSIVKQICDMNHYTINYKNDGEIHCVTVMINSEVKYSNQTEAITESKVHQLV